MVNNRNSDYNKRKEENKNNSHNHPIDCIRHCTPLTVLFCNCPLLEDIQYKVFFGFV